MTNELWARRRTNSGDDNLIPLINIVFLLLIFFLIAGQISHIREDGIAPPVSASERPIGQPEWVVSINASGDLAFNNQPLVPDDLASAMAAELPGSMAPVVSVKADRAVTAARLDDVFRVLREEGVATITLFSSGAEGQ